MVWQSQTELPHQQFENRSRKAPSPWGDGRGEGDRIIRTAWIRLKAPGLRSLRSTRYRPMLLIYFSMLV
jgi:hypothetical protein